MNKLEVGMYVRTINGEICKLIDDFALIYFQKEQEYGIPEHQIIKASHNIIDLIEEGDYVNGEKIDSLLEDKKLLTEAITNAGIDGRIINSSDIKSIVTKEQFESMEYKVGDSYVD